MIFYINPGRQKKIESSQLLDPVAVSYLVQSMVSRNDFSDLDVLIESGSMTRNFFSPETKRADQTISQANPNVDVLLPILKNYTLNTTEDPYPNSSRWTYCIQSSIRDKLVDDLKRFCSEINNIYEYQFQNSTDIINEDTMTSSMVIFAAIAAVKNDVELFNLAIKNSPRAKKELIPALHNDQRSEDKYKCTPAAYALSFGSKDILDLYSHTEILECAYKDYVKSSPDVALNIKKFHACSIDKLLQALTSEGKYDPETQAMHILFGDELPHRLGTSSASQMKDVVENFPVYVEATMKVLQDSAAESANSVFIDHPSYSRITLEKYQGLYFQSILMSERSQSSIQDEVNALRDDTFSKLIGLSEKYPEVPLMINQMDQGLVLTKMAEREMIQSIAWCVQKNGFDIRTDYEGTPWIETVKDVGVKAKILALENSVAAKDAIQDIRNSLKTGL